MRSRSVNCRGAAAVEFALVLPVLLALVLGVIDWGWYFCVREAAINAAREGARTAALLGNTTTNGVARANQYLNNVGICAGGARAGDAAVGNVNVTVTCDGVVLTQFFPATLIPRTLTVSSEMRHE